MKERMRPFQGKELFFFDCGAGGGALSAVLLGMGFKGAGFDLNKDACRRNEQRNSAALLAGHYAVRNEDFFSARLDCQADIILSSMFLEHLDEAGVERYFRVCGERLRPGGRLVILVPGCRRHWGVEDDIAGHEKRYEFEDFRNIEKKGDWRLEHLAGLTYPLSNWLLPLSNRLVERHEGTFRALPGREKTLLSGDRHVPFKTEYPALFKLVLNPFALFPFHVLQRLFRNHPESLVLYAEMTPARL